MKSIIRSIALSEELDEALRVLAFHTGSSKQDLIIKLLKQGIEQNKDILDTWAPNILKRLSDE